MPLTREPFPACRNRMKPCHVALWASTVSTVDESGGALAGRQGRERQRKKKEKKENMQW